MIAPLALALAALLAPPAATAPVTFVPQGRAPWCSAAAVVMAANARGAHLTLKPLVRALPVAADGVAWVDLRAHLAPAVEVLPVHGSRAELIEALAAGVPVVLSVQRGAGRHALVVTGYDPEGVQVMDPGSGPGALSWAALERVWGPQRPMVLAWPVEAAPGGLPLGRWRAQARRYAAEAWARRAARSEGAGALALYDQAVAADPGFGAVRYDRAVRWGQAGRPGGAVYAELIRAGADGAPAAAVDAARRAFSCPPPGPPGASSPSPPASPRRGGRRPASGSAGRPPSPPGSGAAAR